MRARMAVMSLSYLTALIMSTSNMNCFLLRMCFLRLNVLSTALVNNSAGISSDPVPRTVEQNCFCIPHTLFSFFLLSSD